MGKEGSYRINVKFAHIMDDCKSMFGATVGFKVADLVWDIVKDKKEKAGKWYCPVCRQTLMIERDN